METVSVRRTFNSSAEPITSVMSDIKPFMESAGFDTVIVDGDHFTIENSVGLLSLSLELQLLDTDDALAYKQTDGMFKHMETRYELDEDNGTTTVSVTTEFELDASIVGPILDSTVISRQRRNELTKQFDYLERELES